MPLSTASDSTAPDNSPFGLAQRQLDAYNARDIDAFLEPYAEDVEIYNFPNELVYRGRDLMRTRYGEKFAQTPELHCELRNRIVHGDTVMDHERVTLGQGRISEVIAIYRIERGRIAKVWFVR